MKRTLESRLSYGLTLERDVFDVTPDDAQWEVKDHGRLRVGLMIPLPAWMWLVRLLIRVHVWWHRRRPAGVQPSTVTMDRRSAEEAMWFIETLAADVGPRMRGLGVHKLRELHDLFRVALDAPRSDVVDRMRL